MFIEHLEIFRFRNLGEQSVDFGPGVVALVGQNAQGKTNALEALYVCATGKSFRGASPRELIAHGEEKATLRARFLRHGVRHDVEVAIFPTRRSVRVDDRLVSQTSRLLELLNVVAFFPDDLRIVKGSPEERRRFLDRAVANASPEFVDAAIAYGKVLKARNSLLRAPQVDTVLLGVHNDQLVEYGTIIQQCRERALEALKPVAEEHFARVMRTGVSITLGLDPGLGAEGALYSPEAFLLALERSYPRDRKRGITHVGPHRADLLMSLDGQPARAFASQGQQRALVLSLKLAEVQILEGKLGCAPILLLDDVSSELDTERSRALFDLVERLESQVWLTTTGAVELPLPQSTAFYGVRGGTILPGQPKNPATA